jgi:hypothetical protein
MEEFRFGTGRYVNTNDNLRKVLTAVARMGLHGTHQFITASPNNTGKKSRAGAWARRIAYRDHIVTPANIQSVIMALRRRHMNDVANDIETLENNANKRRRVKPYLLYANENAVGDVENYFTGLGMTNAHKLKVFKALYAPAHYPEGYPYREAAHRAVVTNNYAPNARDMDWFNHANKAAWAQRVANNARSKARTAIHALKAWKGRKATTLSAGLRTVLPNNVRKEFVNSIYPGSKFRR